MRMLLALALLCASAARAAEKGQQRFSGGKMKSQGVQKSQKADEGSAFSRRWSRGARGRSSVSSGSGKVTYKANTQGFTRMAEGDQRPQDFGLSAPVAGAKVQPLGHQTGPGGPFAERTIDAGGQIGFDPGKSVTLDAGRGVHTTPADKLPPVSTLSGASAGGSGGASGATGITANTAPTTGQ